MAKPDTSIDPRIMDSAKEEFRTLGFEKASLKSICQRGRRQRELHPGGHHPAVPG